MGHKLIESFTEMEIKEAIRENPVNWLIEKPAKFQIFEVWRETHVVVEVIAKREVGKRGGKVVNRKTKSVGKYQMGDVRGEKRGEGEVKEFAVMVIVVKSDGCCGRRDIFCA